MRRLLFIAALIALACISFPEIVADTVSRVDRWTAKIMGRSTELHIRPNTDHSGLYLVNLTVAARTLNLDLRCM